MNSANSPAAFTITGWPEGSRAQNAFDNSVVCLADATPLQLELPAYGVVALRFSKQK